MTKHVRIKALLIGVCLILMLIAGIYWMEMALGTGASADYAGAVFAEMPMDGDRWIQLLSI